MKQFRSHLLVAAAATAVAVVYIVLLLAGAGGLPNLTEPYRVSVLLPSASSLTAQSRVTEAGVDIGHVAAVTRRGRGALVELEIDSDHAPLPDDSRAGLRLRTLVGEKSVEVTPGASKTMLPAGGLLPAGQEDDFVEVDAVLSQLRGSTRAQARRTVQALGHSVTGRGAQLNRLLAAFSGTVEHGAPVVHVLAEDRKNVHELVSNLGTIAQEVGDRRASIHALATGLNGTARAIADRDSSLRATLASLPPMLDQVQATAGVVQRTSEDAAPVLDDLARAVRGIGPSVAALRPAAAAGIDVMHELAPAAPRLERTLAAVQRLDKPTKQTVPRLQATLCQLNPMLDYLRPYGPEVAGLFTNLASAVNAYDNNGHIARLYIGVNENSLIGAVPAGVIKAQKQLTEMGLLQKISLLGYNPYPGPGHAGDIATGAHSIGPRDAVNAYPRVHAAC